MSVESGVAWARARIGMSENPAGTNKGPGITQWQVDSGYPWVATARAGVPWCQCYTNAAAAAGGAPQLKTGYTPFVLAGRYRAQGFIPVAVPDARAGDWIYFKWPGVSHDPCDHVGILLSQTASTTTCLEGNTSPGDVGSQNNGGGVHIRTRPKSVVVGAVRVPYQVRRDAHRVLKSGVVGDDVRAFQSAVNERADGCGRPDRRCVVDGEYGPETRENGAWAAFLLGIGESTADVKEGGISVEVQEWVRSPDSRNDEQKARAAERRPKLCAR